MNKNKAVKFHGLSKIKRSELEAFYHNIQKENIQLRKALQRQFSETNRLRCQLIEVLNLLNCKKLLRHPIQINEKEKNLQLYVQLLTEKVSILTHQLLNHSRFHTEVHKCYRGKTQSIYPYSIFPNVQNVDETATKSDHAEEILLKNYPNEDMKFINGMEEIEEEGSNHTNSEVIKVSDNIDIIRLKILIKRLTVQNAALAHHVDSADKETAALRKELVELQSDFAELSKQIAKEKEKFSSIQTLIVEVTSLKQRNKILLEEIREIQEEKAALKNANQKLLEELNDINEKANSNNTYY